MKKGFIYVCTINFLLLATAGNSISQTRQIKFNLVSGTNGVSIGKINGMTRDKRGYMWFSDQTNRCIIQFDGSHMTKYVYDPNNTNSLGGYYPECLATDSSGNIWIGFYGMGLDRYNPVTNEFTHFRNQKNDPASLSNDSVSVVFVDHLNNVWVGNMNGLDLLDSASGKFRRFRNDPKDSTSLSHNKVRGIYEDQNNELWIGTGFTWDQDQEGGLNRFNRNTSTFTRFLHSHSNPAKLSDNKVRAMLEDSYGNFWVGTRQNGLHTLDRKTGIVTRYPTLPSTRNGLGIPSPSAFDDNITFITEDADRKIWIGTMLSGIIRYDPEKKQMIRYGTRESKEYAFRDTTSWWAHVAPDGNLWVSTQSANLYRIDIHNLIIPSFSVFSDNGAIALAIESPNEVWYGTNRGLLLKDYQNGTEKRFTHNPRDPNSISSNNVHGVLKDSKGNLWAGASNALNLYDNKLNIFKRYYHLPGKNLTFTEAIRILHEDEEGNIWVGTYGAGLFKFNPETAKFVAYLPNSVDGNAVSSGVVSSMLTGEKNTLWIGTGNNGGLDKMHLKTGKVLHYLPGMTIYCLYKDHDGGIWVGTPAGLFRYDTTNDRFVSSTELNPGLSLIEVESIVEDNEHNLWVGSETGLYMINRERDRMIRYGQANGLFDANNAFHFNAAIIMPDGQLQFGYFGGYYAFYPNKLRNTRKESSIYFTGLWLNYKPVMPGDGGPLTESINQVKEIHLNHNQNVFSITATMIDFRTDGDKRIYYKLENYDNDWRAVNPEEQIQYFKVPPGKYIFRIKTTNSGDGSWQEKNILLNISPPWWISWWAYCIYVILFIALVVFIHRYQKNRVIKSEREKTRAKQLEQAMEIEKAYHELRATQTQLIQSEKMASLGELTAGIAHEIQNPLNFVNNFSELNSELIEELKSEMKTGNVQQANLIAEEIKINEQKIIHHGKRADGIVKGMLQHSRNSSGTKEPTDINALADEFLRLAYHGFRAKETQDAAYQSFNTIMKTDFDPAVGNVKVVPQEIGRVILNLINNAFYALRERQKLEQSNVYEPTVTVATKKFSDRIEIHVTDNGGGIPTKNIVKIFQPFFTTKPTGQGTGLGLSLSYDIVKAHGGEISVNTETGKGSTFTIRIPAN